MYSAGADVGNVKWKGYIWYGGRQKCTVLVQMLGTQSGRASFCFCYDDVSCAAHIPLFICHKTLTVLG